MAASLHHMMEHPLGIFALLVAIAVLVPPLTRRLRLPDLVGLLAAGEKDDAQVSSTSSK